MKAFFFLWLARTAQSRSHRDRIAARQPNATARKRNSPNRLGAVLRRRASRALYAARLRDVVAAIRRIRTGATGERSKALQGVVPVPVMGLRRSGETTQATD